MHKILLSVMLTVTLLYAQANEGANPAEQPVVQESVFPSSVDQIATVRKIIEKTGMKNVSVESITKQENGNIVYLDLSNSDVSKDGISVIPPEIGQLVFLKTFLCKDNIIAEIPPEIGNLQMLENLVAMSNRIQKISPEIGKCSSLIDLDLRHNRIELLPIEIGELKSIKKIRLWGNKLTYLPESIGNLSTLIELYLKDNRLENLPLSLTKLKLEYIDIIGNKLCNLPPAIESWVISIDKKYKQSQKCW